MAEPRDGRQRPWFPLLVYPTISAIVLAAAFPPIPLGFLACVGLIPLLLSAERLQGRDALKAGFLHGVVFCGATIYWIAWITPVGTAAAIVYLGLFKALLVWALSAVLRRFKAAGLWIAPFLWVGLEYLGSLGDMGFPWLALGNTQSHYLPLIQYAEVTGVYGVSFWIVAVNVTALILLRGRVRRSGAAAALFVLFAVPFAHGLWVLSNSGKVEKTIPVGIVQSNVDPTAKENWGFDYNYGILEPLTIQAVSQGAQLVVWPEAALPGYFESAFYRRHRDRVQHLADSLNVYIYTGGSHLEVGEEVRKYNSSFLFSSGKTTLQRYDKTRLVPFGERAPFPKLLPFLRQIKWSGGGFVSANWDAGEVRTVFEGPNDVRFSGLICFDSVFPGFVREFVARGAAFLVVMTNDGWFGRTSGPYQHMEMAVFRAVENRRTVVRCANTGVSLFVDPYGRGEQTTGIFHKAVLVGEVAARTQVTFYTRYGDVFSQVCCILVVLVLVAVAIEWKRHRGVPAAAGMVRADGDEGALEGEAFAGSGKPMPFLDHLEELRWRILKGLAAVAAGAILCGIFGDEILAVLKRPILDLEPRPVLIFLKPMGMFVVKLNIALVGGGVLALPVVLYQVWLFVAPGLFANERRYIAFIIVSSTVCFVVGAMVCYWGVVPLALKFLVGLGADPDILPQFDIGMYIGFVLRLLVAFGVVFELPVATFFLTKVGVLTEKRMRAGRRYAILGGFVLAAFLTPPDPISQLMMAVPLVLLYEISIWVARLAEAGRGR